MNPADVIWGSDISQFRTDFLPISRYPSIYMSNNLSVNLSIDLFIHLFIHLYIYLSIYLSIHLSIYLSIHLSIYLSIYISIYPSIYLSMKVFVYILFAFRLQLFILQNVYFSLLFKHLNFYPIDSKYR